MVQRLNLLQQRLDELGVVRWPINLGQIPIGSIHRGDPMQCQFSGKSTLMRTEGPFASPRACGE